MKNDFKMTVIVDGGAKRPGRTFIVPIWRTGKILNVFASEIRSQVFEGDSL
jgi:hypothetical protein